MMKKILKRTFLIFFIFLIVFTSYGKISKAQNINIQNLLQGRYSSENPLSELIKSFENFGYGQNDNIFSEIMNLNLQIETTPQFPKANEDVSIRIDSFRTDLNRAYIEWKIDGEMLKEGIGLTVAEIKMGGVGKIKEIIVKIKTIEGLEEEKSFFITPSEVNILWHANSYTPPLYKGKPLLTNGGGVTITAIPNLTDENGNRINNINLLYNWRINGSIQPELSGFGKKTIEIDEWNTGTRGLIVSVTAETLNGSIRVGNTKTINSTSIDSHIYKVDPLYGNLFNKSIRSEFPMEDDDIVLRAYPYFIDKKHINGTDLQYGWSVDGRNIDLNSDTIALSAQGLTGLSNVTFSIIDRVRIISSRVNASLIIK